MKDEEKASGIECDDLSEVEKALEETSEKEVAAEDTVENNKKKVINAKAVEMRNIALESLGKTQKRQQKEEEDNATPKQKKVVEVVTQLHIWAKKNDLVQKRNEEELKLQKRAS